MDAITITGICTAIALFTLATAAAWKAGKLPATVLYISIAIAAVFLTVTILRMNNGSTLLITAHTLLAVVFIILAKNNITIAFNLIAKPKSEMKQKTKQQTEEQKFEEYSNALHNLQGKVANGKPLTHEEKLLLEYYIEWIRSYKSSLSQARQVSVGNRR